jgi:hypothetical protein
MQRKYVLHRKVMEQEIEGEIAMCKDWGFFFSYAIATLMLMDDFR